MSDKIYPAILKLDNGCIVLATKLRCGIALSEYKDEYEKTYKNCYYKDFHGFERATNITHEYLANSYGEVVSPEHAEFIIELCLENSISFAADNARRKYFAINSGKFYFFCLEIDASNIGSKKITIPLPPKQIQTATPEEEFEMKQIMKNAGDNLVLGCEDSKCDEWPCMGDEVTVRIDAHQWDVKYGHNVDGMNGVVRSVFEDGDTTVYAVSVDGVCYCFVRGLLLKPKTPEEELRDELIEYLNELGSSARYCFGGNELAADELLKTYNITKNPQ